MKPAPKKQSNSQKIEVHIGTSGISVGELIFVQDGRREFSQFSYASSWLTHADTFAVSPDLPLGPGHVQRKAPSRADSVFHLAFADSTPDAWGRRVIERAHAKARKRDKALSPLTELDYLCAVDDFSRVGALRLHKDGTYLQTSEAGRRTTPVFLDLERLYRASRAVEDNTETLEDLKYLQGSGTSLGGMRPKCTVVDENGKLAIGKFPSTADTISVTRGEVLALLLSRRAGINTVTARIVDIKGTPVAVIERFDRRPGDQRVPYLSAASMLQASREEDRAYSEVVDVIRQQCKDPDHDAQELWRRLVFNLLITNTDDHLQNHGFLYVGQGKWELAPAFDVNPMPGKQRESKTLLTRESGPIDSVDMLLEEAPYFSLSKEKALEILAAVLTAVENWRAVALSGEVGLTTRELSGFEDAFEHDITEEARKLLTKI